MRSGRVRCGVSFQTWTLMVALTLWLCFLICLRTVHVMPPPRLSVAFPLLVCQGSFPMSPQIRNEMKFRFRVVYIATVSVKPTSVGNYRQISITSALSKVFERQVFVRLGRFMELSCVLPTTQFAYQKSLDTWDTLLWVSHTLQSALECGQEARIVQIGFSAAFDGFNHRGFSIISALWVF